MSPEPIAVVPAAGTGSRVAPLPCSKEIYPVGFGPTDEDPVPRPRVGFHYLLDSLRVGGARRGYVVLRPGKWDVPEYLGDGGPGLTLAYVVTRRTEGVPHTVDQAYPFLRGAPILFGLADILFRPRDAYARLVRRLDAGAAEVVLGLFPTTTPQKSDMVGVGGDGTILSVVCKPRQTDLIHTWLIAAWTPRFTDFLHAQVGHERAVLREGRANGRGGRGADAERRPELYMGHVLQAAIDGGLRVEGVVLEDGHYRDIGTPDDLRAASHAWVG